MGIEERKTRERDERRTLILQKAKTLILERGISSLTMQDIAVASELSKATLYIYFENKDAILTVILEESVNAFVDFAKSRIPDDVPGIGALQALWECYLDLLAESQDLLVLTGIKNYIDPEFPFGDRGNSENLARSTQALVDLLAQLLRRGMADGSVGFREDPERLARTVIMIATSVVDTISRIPRARRDTALMKHEMSKTFEIILRGLASDSSDHSHLRMST